MFLVELETKAKIPILARSDRILWRTAFDNADGNLFLITLAGDGSYRFALERYSLATKERSAVISLVGAEPEMTLSPDGNRMALWFASPGGTTTLVRENTVVLLNGRTGTKTNEFRLPRGAIYFDRSAWRPDSREIGFSVGGENYTHDVYSIDAETGKLTRWYPPEGETTGLYLQPAAR